MLQQSGPIFKWDPEDTDRLYNAKQAQLLASGVVRVERDDIARNVSKKELATHCKRQTRGSEECFRLIQQFIETFSSDLEKDTMGIPLLDADRAW